VFAHNRTVTVTLNSTNSLKVQGAGYTIDYPEGFVQDTLPTPNVSYSLAAEITRPGTVTNGIIPAARVGTLARPFIRSSNPTERISEADGLNGRPTASAYHPRFYVAPLDRATRAWVRMDTRTPGASVRYGINSSDHTADSVNLLAGGDGITAATSAITAPARPGTLPNAATVSIFNASGHSCNTASCTNLTLHQVGEAPTTTYARVQGLRYRIYAVSEKDGVLSANPAEEMLYRTVLTFLGYTGNMSDQQFGDGDQVWVRGGNNTTSSTIAGFPLTWQDNFANLKRDGEQAGIRLLTRINTDSTALRYSEWQWITWDIKAPAFISLFLGRDVEETIGGVTIRASTAAEVQQFGPKTAAVQRNNWTLLFSEYRLHPGLNRFLNTQNPNMAGGGSVQDPFQFNAAPVRRPAPLTITGRCAHLASCDCTP
jgi:hypothetical protein